MHVNHFPANWMPDATSQERARAWLDRTTQAERDEINALRTAARKAVSEANAAVAALEIAQRYSTPVLQAIAEDGGSEVGVGRYREALALLRQTTIDTPARRRRVIAIAHTGSNLGLWGRWSDAVHYAAVDLARMIADGREADEHYTERTAREACEHEADRQAALLQAAADSVRKPTATVTRHRAPSGNRDADSFAATCERCGWTGASHSNRTIEGKSLAERDAQQHRCRTN